MLNDPASHCKKKRRRRGEREDGRILVTLFIGWSPSGKRMRKYFYGRTRQEAERKRENYKRMINLGLTTDACDMTLNEWIDQWYGMYKTNVNEDYKASSNVPINRLRSALGDRMIRSIVEADLQQALLAVSDMSSSTIKKYHSVIKQIFSKAKKNKIIQDDPSDDLIVPRGSEGSHRALERWESEAILNHWSIHRAGIWALLMLLCGLRKSEMIALDWKNVDMEKRQITVCEAAVILKNQTVVRDRTKSPAGMRILPICDRLYEALDSIPPSNRTGPVCVSSAGKRLTASGFFRGWSSFNNSIQRVLNGEDPDQRGRRETLEDRIALAKKEGREYILFNVLAHDLRHTFATALYDAGISIKAAQYYLGHADAKMTLDLYTHLSQERENRERVLLTGFLDDWIGGGIKNSPET